MPTATSKTRCFTCNKEKIVYKCEGCSKDFCFHHLTEHRQKLSREFDEIENDRNLFRQTLIEFKEDSTKHSLIQQINQWENDSIRKIKQKANECRHILTEHINKYINEIETKLTKLTEKLREIREENEFNEIDLNQLKIKLTKLTEELYQPPNISIEQDSKSFINKISVVVSSINEINVNTKWKQNGITIAGGNDEGNKLNQLCYPNGIFIDDDDQTIYIADSGNNRIISWKPNDKNGRIVADGNGRGIQLNFPTGVIINKQNNSFIIADHYNRRLIQWSRQNNTEGQIIIENIDCYGLTMDKNGYLYVSDWEKNEVRRWKIGDQNGTIVAGGNGEGDRLNQFNHPTYIFVDEDCSLYVSDRNNHRVMKWIKGAKEGIVVAGGNDQGTSLTQLYDPYGIIVNQFGQIYVADSRNHRIIRWFEGAKEGTIVVGGNGKEQQSNQFYHSNALSFDTKGNLYITDCFNHRIQKFELDVNNNNCF